MQKYNMPCPTEIKMFYNVRNNSLEVKYQYESVHDKMDRMNEPSVIKQWDAELKKEYQKRKKLNSF